MRFNPPPGPLFALLRAIPQRLLQPFAKGVGTLLFWVLASRRRIMLDNLAHAYPDWPESEHRRIAKASWANLVQTACELIRFPTHLERMFAENDFEVIENFRVALAKGKGVLAIVPHMGNWELGAAHGAQHLEFCAITRPVSQSKLAEAIEDIREAAGVKVYKRKNALKGILGALRRGSIVAVMLDQHAGKNGVKVSFFGRPVSTFSSVAYLALKTGVPVIPGYSYRREDGSTYCTVGKEFPLIDTGNLEADIVTNTQNYTTAIEEIIRPHPESWMWMHRRWR